MQLARQLRVLALSNSKGGTTMPQLANHLAQHDAAAAFLASIADEVRETHISLVYCVGDRVHKLKKPVKLDFLDFSTREKRHQACEAELRLNRRLGPDVYLGVHPIVRGANGLQIGDAHHDGGEDGGEDGGDESEVVDWVVTMKRLRDEQTLQSRMDQGAVGENDVAAVSCALWEFFRTQGAAPVTVEEYLARFDHHIRDNRASLLAHHPRVELDAAHEAGDREQSAAIRRIHTSLLQFLHTHHDQMRQRVAEGRIIEAHGDLRPEHVYLSFAGPVFLDCIEFSEEFRTNDMLDEICFLAMECERQSGAMDDQAAEVGRRLLEHYRMASNDAASPELAAFYKCYRACVRAKVACLRASQLRVSQVSPDAASDDASRAERELIQLADRYIQLADDYAMKLGRPTLFIVRGLAGTGKSTVARALAERLACEHFQTDVLRQEVFDADRSPDGADHNQGVYSLQSRWLVYQQLLSRGAAELRAGRSVVLDGAFLSRQSRQEAIAMAATVRPRSAQCDVDCDDDCDDGAGDVWLVNCDCPQEVAERRILERLRDPCSPSEATVETHRQQREEEEPLGSNIRGSRVETTHRVEALVDSILDQLREAQRARSVERRRGVEGGT